MSYKTYAFKRILAIIPTFLVVSFLLYFFLLVVYHGKPEVLYINTIQEATYYATHPAALAALKHKYGFDQPWYIQYIMSTERILFGNWGITPVYGGQSVFSVFSRAFPNTVEIVVPAFIIVLLVGIPLGIKASVSKSEKTELYITGPSVIGMSIPAFVSAIIVQGLIHELSFFLIYRTNNLQFSGYSFYSGLYSSEFFHYPRTLIFGLQPTGFLLIDSLLSGNFLLFIDGILHLIGPVFCLVLTILPYVVRMTRNAMHEVLDQDYILLAKSKGLPDRVIHYPHAFRNALIPILTMAGYLFSMVFFSTIFIEIIFNYPGIGNVLYAGLVRFDLAIIQGFLTFTTLIYILFNLFVDLANA